MHPDRSSLGQSAVTLHLGLCGRRTRPEAHGLFAATDGEQQHVPSPPPMRFCFGSEAGKSRVNKMRKWVWVPTNRPQRSPHTPCLNNFEGDLISLCAGEHDHSSLLNVSPSKLHGLTTSIQLATTQPSAARSGFKGICRRGMHLIRLWAGAGVNMAANVSGLIPGTI